MRIPILAVVTVLAVHGSFALGQTGSQSDFDPVDLLRDHPEIPVPTLSRPAVFYAEPIEQVVVRAQGPTTFETPPIMAPGYQAQSPYMGEAPRDPFLYGDPVLGDPGGSTVLSGVNGPQPYRMGFTPKFEYTLLGPAGTQSPGNGRFTSNEFNFELAHTQVVGPGWVFTNTPQAGVRLWEGPGTPDLPGSVYRMGWDFTLATPIVGLWSMQLDFNPSINTDFQSGLAREALNLDGNAMLFYRASPQWMFVLGAGYWDRVDKIILPYAGVVWNPNELWELRLLFPKSRVSYFVGNIGGASHWLYATGEYHVESYQIEQSSVSGNQQVQMQDWRLALGLRSDHVTYDKFFEVGYVFGRNVDFKNTTPGFSINDTLMVRFGIKF